MLGRFTLVVVLLATALAVPNGGVPATPTPTITVRLTAGKIMISRGSVPAGLVRFVVVGGGRVAKDFAVGGKRTRLLEPGQRETLVVRFAKPGAYRFVSRIRGRTIGARGTIRVLPPPGSEDEPKAGEGLKLTAVGTFEMPTDVDAPPGDPERLVVLEQGGLIHVVVNGERRSQPFLDLRAQTKINGEAGLLGLAFAPDYAESGLFYVYLNDRAGNLRLVEYRRAGDDPDRADPGSARELLSQIKFSPNHNGGMLQFGPGGKLYVAVGDGGSGNGVKPGQYAQSLDTIFGKILRVDVSSGAHEIWARGLRNPWRFWLDAVSGLAYVGDVGQEQREEVDVALADGPPVNFGWPCFEGSVRFDVAETCPDAVAPVYEYAHSASACSITGGLVVRDARLPALAGAYLFGDFCGTSLSSLGLTGGTAEVTRLGVEARSVISFGVDGLDRVHLGLLDGTVLRLDPA